jgi:hypothetical protein
VIPILKADFKYTLILGHGLVAIEEDVDTCMSIIFLVIRMLQYWFSMLR